MEMSKGCKKVCLLLLYLTIAATSFAHCDARRSMHLSRGPVHARSSIIKNAQKLKVTKRFDLASLLLQKETMDSSNAGPYVSSPFTLPPYDSLGPISLPDNAPPNCIYPPNTPQPPSTGIPTPTGSMPSSPPPPFGYLPPVFPISNPPPSPTGEVPGPPCFIPIPNPPEIVPSPPINIPGTPEGAVPSPTGIIPGSPGSVPSPTIYVPGPPEAVPGPPYYEPSPPSYTPSPPTFVPSPTGFVPSPRGFRPPVLYPPPTGPPSPRTSPYSALWCVAKPSVPDPIIQEAMNYACGSGADCDSILPSGSCFEPDTLFAHASYAFNSYWQRTRVAGGSCSFGGTAILVTVDPSYDGCHFIYG
ncbi:pollen-specific leucine-rich repeat extensin-like protein 3 [Populus alba x Populus x berolinensis]|uniref:Pollen-specific leucine-rich repeat extensin-like protein 3 n=1 Tax=Populus alba x Populus x berolinensis TaxID=444605 RepID=A0AAD6QAD2_9ROSI|nr:pollen-specific leucine-rich repeat extensin-like protein 3 [Populus alba x Populus x berolinensis]